MGLADQLGNTPERLPGKPCSVGALEDHLSGKEADAFYAMLHTLGWSGSRVYKAVQAEAKALRNAGNLEDAAVYAAMGQQTVNRHRSRACRCFKDAA